MHDLPLQDRILALELRHLLKLQSLSSKLLILQTQHPDVLVEGGELEAAFSCEPGRPLEEPAVDGRQARFLGRILSRLVEGGDLQPPPARFFFLRFHIRSQLLLQDPHLALQVCDQSY